MKKTHRGAFALVLIATLALAATPALAQDDGPENRVLVVTSFDVPYQHRSTVFPWMVEYFIPGLQLNPNVLNLRVLWHWYGPQASQVSIAAEYAEFADIEAECGAPCEEYQEAHPTPEEGDEGYEAYQEAQEIFNKYFSHHTDMIYVSGMQWAKTDGELHGRVGPPPDEE